MNIVIKVLGFIHNSTTCIKVNFGVSIRQGESGLCVCDMLTFYFYFYHVTCLLEWLYYCLFIFHDQGHDRR